MNILALKKENKWCLFIFIRDLRVSRDLDETSKAVRSRFMFHFCSCNVVKQVHIYFRNAALLLFSCKAPETFCGLWNFNRLSIATGWEDVFILGWTLPLTYLKSTNVSSWNCCFLGAFTFPPNNLICVSDFTIFHQHFHQPPEDKRFKMSIQL